MAPNPMKPTAMRSLAPLTLPVKSEVVNAVAAVPRTSRRAIPFLRCILTCKIPQLSVEFDWPSRSRARIGEMLRTMPRLLWVVLPLAYLIYFFHLGAVGLLGPDEPRDAAVAREMARSGDWSTPRLWSQPWVEKPVLLYWMSGAAFKLGMGPELAPRLPVALLAAGFLGFYWWILRREFGCRAAWLAALILGSSGMWIGYSQVGVTDLPLATTFSAAML